MNIDTSEINIHETPKTDANHVIKSQSMDLG